VEFYASLAREVEPPVLELGCGTGRVTVALARGGIPVIGLDRSLPMLRVAERTAAGVQGVRWVQGDMRSFDLRERFGLICIPFRSFQHLLTVHDQRATLERCFHHLRPGGVLALNLYNPPSALVASLWGSAGSRRTTPSHMHPRRLSSAYPGRPLCYVVPEEMRNLLVRAGFEVDGLYGGFNRAAFDSDSPEQVWVARRR